MQVYIVSYYFLLLCTHYWHNNFKCFFKYFITPLLKFKNVSRYFLPVFPAFGILLVNYIYLCSEICSSSCQEYTIQIFQIFSGVNCTQADLEAIIDGNDDVVLLGLDTNKLYYEYTYNFKCNETGKSFMNTDTDEYQTYVTATCQANKTWSISTIPYECECEYCETLK